MPFFETELEKVPGDGHILAAVFNQFLHLPLAEPLHGLKAVGAFTLVQRLLGQMVQAQPEAEPAVDVLQDVERGERSEVPAGVCAQDPAVTRL